MPKLALYHYVGCGFCARVWFAAKRLGVELDSRNIHKDPAHRAALLEARGRTTVPVLHIEHEDGRVEWMPESADIVAYLQENYG